MWYQSTVEKTPVILFPIKFTYKFPCAFVVLFGYEYVNGFSGVIVVCDLCPQNLPIVQTFYAQIVGCLFNK